MIVVLVAANPARDIGGRLAALTIWGREGVSVLSPFYHITNVILGNQLPEGDMQQ